MKKRWGQLSALFSVAEENVFNSSALTLFTATRRSFDWLKASVNYPHINRATSSPKFTWKVAMKMVWQLTTTTIDHTAQNKYIKFKNHYDTVTYFHPHRAFHWETSIISCYWLEANHLCWGVACTRHKTSCVRRQTQAHHITSVTVKWCCLLSRLNVPQCTAIHTPTHLRQTPRSMTPS